MLDHIIDVKDQKLGRVASKIAMLLQGKDQPTYEPRKIGDNRVIVKNIALLKVTGDKFNEKVYYHHTGYMGHLKTKKYREIFEKNPEWILRHAVEGMLPKNFINAKRLKQLIFEKENGKIR